MMPIDLGFLLRRALLAAMVGSGAAAVCDAAFPSSTAAAACAGDCDDSGAVTIDELVDGVNIALGAASLEECPPLDCNATGRVSVDCLVGAVSAALHGCEQAPTATSTETVATSTPTNTPSPSPTSTSTPTATPTATTTPTIATASCGTFLAKFGGQGSG